MEALFEICCGANEERSKDTGFTGVDEDDDEKDLTAPLKRIPTKEKAAVQVCLKHQKNIFSSPMDPKAKFDCHKFHKTPEEEEFLRSTVKNHVLLKELSQNELQQVIEATEKIEIPGSDKMIEPQDGDGEYLWILQKGKLELYCEKTKKKRGILVPGDVWGELSLLYGSSVLYSVLSREPCVLWRIDQMTFRYVLAKHASEQDEDILTCLKKVELFQNMSEPQLRKFASAMTRVRFEEGDRIVQKGEKGEVFYIIEQGMVRVHDIGMGDSQTADQFLKEGEGFGERSLLTGEVRGANITAMSSVVVALVMHKHTFEQHIGELHHLMDFRVKLQTLKSLPIFENTDTTESEFSRLAELTEELCYMKGAKLSEAGKPYPLKIWLIRKGRVLLYGGKDGKIYNLQNGDYYGVKSILGDPEHVSKFEATCETNLRAWVLSRDAIESVIVDLSRLVQAGSYRKSKSIRIRKPVQGLKDLKRHRILGQGGFGKVYLVESKVYGIPYALKVIHKRLLLQSKQERSILREKELLRLLRHPFILDLVSSFQDSEYLYLVTPLIQGGELFNVVTDKASKKWKGALSNNDAVFYAAGVIEALGHFHHRYIAYRDLKLENIMIDADGYPKIVDLGFAKVIVDKSYTFCGTPGYLAPEIIMSKGHNHAVDYWSFAVLVYEMLAGTSPFQKPNSTDMEMFKRIVLVKYDIPDYFDDQAQDLMKKLLQRKVVNRLGMMRSGYYDVLDHPWFEASGYDFRKLLKKEITPPWIPTVTDPFDSSNFDEINDNSSKTSFGPNLSVEEQEVFKGF